MESPLFIFVLFLTTGLAFALYDFDDYESPSSGEFGYGEESVPLRNADVCIPQPLGGVDWILSVRQPDYGWKEETHRAVIALSVNKWPNLPPQEVRQMELQLEVELTKSLLRNHTFSIHPNDLALYIHALIATGRNPRNFYGIDLVNQLLHMVRFSSYQVHPFLLLALCNSNEVPTSPLSFSQWMQQNRHVGRGNLEYAALALNAFECLKTLDYAVDERYLNEVRHSIASHQQMDGGFGNIYSTAIIVLALASAPDSLDWNKRQAMNYLKSKFTADVNMVSAYLIELALNSDRVRFVKDLHPNLILGPAPEKHDKDHYFVQYTVRVGEHPDVYFTISIKVPPKSNFFYIMNESAHHDAKFK
ncbi:uncharacterized protein CEXT_311831 [Caerostris extrusa]|uniref:Uncharacterized protein n=1 Tax=Caerostris extrusa TaxID=172846 RepID=A0AAV4M498_CAEEX|nr:uncharacterized protein CEXT_311831 [Caerostris extrusa]